MSSVRGWCHSKFLPNVRQDFYFNTNQFKSSVQFLCHFVLAMSTPSWYCRSLLEVSAGKLVTWMTPELTSPPPQENTSAISISSNRSMVGKVWTKANSDKQRSEWINTRQWETHRPSSCHYCPTLKVLSLTTIRITFPPNDCWPLLSRQPLATAPACLLHLTPHTASPRHARVVVVAAGGK